MKCCASSHEPPDTACRLFEAGQNGRCAYCDHEEKCHPGPGATCEIGNAAKHALILNRNAAITVSETNIMERMESAPTIVDAAEIMLAYITQHSPGFDPARLLAARQWCRVMFYHGAAEGTRRTHALRDKETAELLYRHH